jgi:hypothetical protein
MTRADRGDRPVCGATFPNLPRRRCVLPAGHAGGHRYAQHSNEPRARTLALQPKSWLRTKACPACGERVLVGARVCGACRHRFDRPPPARGGPQISGAASTAFICSLLCVWVVAIPLGIHARRAVDRSGGMLIGRGLSTVAIVIGVIDMIATAGLVLALAN